MTKFTTTIVPLQWMPHVAQQAVVMLHRFGTESQALQPAEALPPPSQIASMMATRGDSFSSQASAGSQASLPARVTTDEGFACAKLVASVHLATAAVCMAPQHLMACF